MKRNRILLTIGAAIGAGLFLILAACEDEPTQAEAEQQFCDDVGVFLASVGALRDVDKDTPISEFEDARENVRTSYENMIASAEQLRQVRLDDLQDANNDLRAAVDDINDEATLQEAIDSIQEEVDAVSKEVSQILNDVNCGSGQGGQERSDE